MWEFITSSNIKQVVQKNKLIAGEIRSLIDDFTVRFNKSGVKGQDKLSISILKENKLIQIPIDDKYWGGAIITKKKIKIPVINTAQPRVYQYFVAWHEIYHMFYDINLSEETHNITIYMVLNGGKAEDLVQKFIDLGLDSELVKPSYVINLGGLEKKVEGAMKNNPEISFHKDNYEFLLSLKQKIKKEVEGLAE